MYKLSVYNAYVYMRLFYKNYRIIIYEITHLCERLYSIHLCGRLYSIYLCGGLL